MGAVARGSGRSQASGQAGRAVGAVTRVNGPLVEVRGLDGIAMREVLALGPQRLAAEIVGISGGRRPCRPTSTPAG